MGAKIGQAGVCEGQVNFGKAPATFCPSEPVIEVGISFLLPVLDQACLAGLTAAAVFQIVAANSSISRKVAR